MSRDPYMQFLFASRLVRWCGGHICRRKILQFATALVPTHTQSLVLRISLMISSVQLIKKSGMACRCSCGKKKQVIRVN